MITEEEKRQHRVCFTGHRPEKLKRSEEEIRRDLRAEIIKAAKSGKSLINKFVTAPIVSEIINAIIVILRTHL